MFDYHPHNLLEWRKAGPAVLPYPVFARLAAQLFDAAGFLHSINVLHRDMKLDNVLVSEAGDAVLSDLGEALVLVRRRAGACVVAC